MPSRSMASAMGARSALTSSCTALISAAAESWVVMAIPCCLRRLSGEHRQVGVGKFLQLRVDGRLRQAIGVVAQGGQAYAQYNLQRLLVVVTGRAERV